MDIDNERLAALVYGELHKTLVVKGRWRDCSAAMQRLWEEAVHEALVRVASLEMHPLDTVDRLGLLKDDLNIGLCNITKCCTEVCPEHIHITDNGIIPLKERVVDAFYDPIARLIQKIFGRARDKRVPLQVISK